MPHTASELAYERIAAELRRRIDEGELSGGALLPSEADIRREFGVARGTVRQALALLESSGLIEVVPAKGRYVKLPTGGAGALAPAVRARDIARELRTEILSGRYGDGDRFLSEKQVCEQFGATRYAARQALADLEAAGLLVSVQARGRFVRRPQSA